MNIVNLQQNNPEFKAIKVASLKNRVLENASNIDIYQIRSEDYGYIQTLSRKINYKTLCPQLAKDLQERWQKIFQYCISKVQDFGNISYLAVQDRKPCGILTYYNDREFQLDGICSIPNKDGQKIHLSGKSLLYKLFKDAESNDVKGIKLDAVTDGPYNVIDKYEKLGFKPLGYEMSDENTLYLKMYCNKHKIKAQLHEFPYEIEYNEAFERARLNEVTDI